MLVEPKCGTGTLQICSNNWIDGRRESRRDKRLTCGE